MMRYSPENINIDRRDTQSQCWYSLVNSISYSMPPWSTIVILFNNNRNCQLYNLKHKFELRALSLMYDRKS